MSTPVITFSKFILKDIEPILMEWEKFAATLVPEAQRMDRECFAANNLLHRRSQMGRQR